MVDLLGERGKKNQGVQHKNCQEPALQMTAKTSGAQLSQPLKLPLRLRSTGRKVTFLALFARKLGFAFVIESCSGHAMPIDAGRSGVKIGGPIGPSPPTLLPTTRY